MNLATYLRRPPAAVVEERAGVVEVFETWKDSTSHMANDFRSYVTDGMQGNGAVFAVQLARLMLFSEVSFSYRDDDTGEWTGPPLLLRRPRKLLSAMIQDVDNAGNAFIYKAERNTWQRLRPDWVEVVYQRGSLFGYLYTVGGSASGGRGVYIDPADMAHWWPIPDPLNVGCGMSWLTPIAREIMADSKMTRHRLNFFKYAATPNMVMTVKGRLNPDARGRLEDALKRRYEGVDNAYRTLLVDSDAEIKTVGSDFRQMDFSEVQGAGEIRIAAAGGVPPVIIGMSKGLEAATYSNYLHAMRRFADGTLRPLWGSATEALENLVPQRVGQSLTYDDRRVPALQQDAKDDAEIQGLKARTMMTLIQAGYEPLEVAKAVWNNDLENLEHTGNIPTTLYPEGQAQEEPATPDTTPADSKEPSDA